MGTRRMLKMIFRFSLVSAFLLTVLWGVWQILAGSVPVTNSLEFEGRAAIKLPVAISRWWDILLGPIASTYLILMFAKRYGDKSDELREQTRRVTVIIGLAMGFVFGLISGMANIPILGLAIGALVGLMVGLEFDFKAQKTGLIGIAAFALSFSLFAGIFSLSLAGCYLVADAAGILVRNVLLGISYFLRKSYWQNIGSWLFAKEHLAKS